MTEELKSEKGYKTFKLPSKNLEKKVLIGGKNLIDASGTFVNIQQHKAAAKTGRKACETPSPYFLRAGESAHRYGVIRQQLIDIIKSEEERKQVLEEAIPELNVKREEFLQNVSEAENKILDNIVRRQTTLEDGMERLAEFYQWSKAIKEQEYKQDMLMKLGAIMEGLFEDLEVYELTLGHLARKDEAYKSKADTLVTKRKVLMDRRESINAQFNSLLEGAEDTKNKLFLGSFELTEKIHSSQNSIHRLEEMNIRKLNEVLELEARIAKIRKKANSVRAENSRFYWFIDWIIYWLIGEDNFTGITKDSSLHEKVQAVIDYHRSLRERFKTVPSDKL